MELRRQRSRHEIARPLERRRYRFAQGREDRRLGRRRDNVAREGEAERAMDRRAALVTGAPALLIAARDLREAQSMARCLMCRDPGKRRKEIEENDEQSEPSRAMA
jgi:hypothetical protein